MKLGYKATLYLIVLNLLTPLYSNACKPQISWGSSVSFCQGNSFTLNAANPNSTYTWSTGATTPSISVNSSGMYWVSVTNPCGTTSDTIQVIVDKPVNVNLGPDRAICAGSSTLLTVPFEPSHSYYWQNGYTGHQLSVNQPGTYHVEVTNACGTYSDTVVISEDQPQNFSLGADIINCSSNSSTLQLPSGISGKIKWSTGARSSSVSVTQTGTYWARVTNACGVFTDTINVAIIGNGKLFPHDTILLCNTGSTTLKSPVSSGSHLWSTNSTATSIQISQAGSYWLQVATACGTFSDTVHLIGVSSFSVNLGPDVALCPGDSVTLTAGNPGSRYAWVNGDSVQTITTDTAGVYWAGVNNGCGWKYDTVRVSITPNIGLDVPDTVYTCQGSPGFLDAGSWGSQTSYLWSDNSTSKVNSSLAVGSHWLKVMNPCDTLIDSFYVKQISTVNLELGPDTSFCGKRMVIFSNVPENGNQFLWSKGGNTTQNLTVTSSGTYWLQVTNACGVFTDTINIQIYKAPKGINADTIEKCPGNGVWLRVASRPATTYQWSSGGNSYKDYVTNPGQYWVTAYNQCDSITDTVYVKDRPVVNFSLPKDTTFCSPQKLHLDFNNPAFDSVVWKSNKARTSVNIRKTGTYWATAYSSCGVYTDTINVTVHKPAKKMLRDTAFCGTGSVTLNVNQPNATGYSWSTNASTSSISVNTVGWYYVDVSSHCGTIRDSAYVDIVNPLPQIDLGRDTLFCSGSLTLDPGSFTNANYLWSTSDTSKTLTVSSTGTYFVEITNSCNTVTDTINVVVTGPPTMALGNNVKFCGGSTLNLNAQNPGCTYQWSTGATSQTLAVTQGGKYWVTIANACGTLTDTIQVIVENPLHHLSLGNDTTICQGDSIELQTQIPGVLTKWQNGSNLPNIFVKQTGDYWVQVSNSCGSWEDTIHVEVQDIPTFTLGPDTAICGTGGSLLLQAPAGMDSYSWNDGSTGTDFLVTKSGTYWLTVTNKCFSYTDTIRIKEDWPINIELGPDTTLCHGEVLVIDANMGHGNFKWDDNSSVPTKTITESGTYWLSAQNSCGFFSDTIEVKFDEPIAIEVVDTLICDGDSAVFDLSEISEDFQWYDGSRQEVRTFDQEGDYEVILNNKCGSFSRIYRVDVSYCECPFFIPNAFTPNGDGTNDEFKVGHSCDLSEYTIQVYNRWGQMVYEGHDTELGWDGTFAGNEVAAGIYTYRITYTWYVYGVDRIKEHTGTLTLMR